MACGSYCRCGCGLRLRPVSSWRHAPTLCLQRPPPPPLASVALFKYRIKSVSDNCKAHCQPDWPISLLLYLLSLFSFSPYTFLPPHLLSFLPCPLFHLSLWLAITQINVVCGKLCKRRHNRNINAHSKQRVVAPRAEGMGGGTNIDRPVSHMTFTCAAAAALPLKFKCRLLLLRIRNVR